MTGVAEKKEVFATVFLCLLSHVNQVMHILVETKKYSQESWQALNNNYLRELSLGKQKHASAFW